LSEWALLWMFVIADVRLNRSQDDPFSAKSGRNQGLFSVDERRCNRTRKKHASLRIVLGILAGAVLPSFSLHDVPPKGAAIIPLPPLDCHEITIS